MSRPPSHREQAHKKYCGNCVFAHLVAYKMDLLCFYGDKIEIHGQTRYPVDADHVYLDGNEIGISDEDEYDKVWTERIVDPDDVCDEWQAEDNTSSR